MHKIIISVGMLLVLLIPGYVIAQNTPYAPVTAIFSGKSALVTPPAAALDINGSGTIELWVAAKWNKALPYDPAIIAYTGPKGPRFSIMMAANKRGLGVYSGQYYDGVNFDFTDSALHYVAIVTIGNSIDVYIDGDFKKTIAFGFADLPATEFSIGSIGNFSPFVGEIGQVRIWDEPIDPDILNIFALRPIIADGSNAHPYINSLVGASTFGSSQSSGFSFVAEPEDTELVNIPNIVFDDGDLAPIPMP